MVANRGAETLFLVFLLSCWPETKLQPTNITSGRVPQRPTDRSVADSLPLPSPQSWPFPPRRTEEGESFSILIKFIAPWECTLCF